MLTDVTSDSDETPPEELADILLVEAGPWRINGIGISPAVGRDVPDVTVQDAAPVVVGFCSPCPNVTVVAGEMVLDANVTDVAGDMALDIVMAGTLVV